MKKGFTLIELLGTIVVLAIIALITIPIISGVVNKARLNSLKNSAYGLIDASNLYYAQYGISNNIRFDIDNNKVLSNDVEEDKMLSYRGSIKEGTVIINTKGKTTVCVTDGKNSAYKNYNESTVTLVSSKRCSVPENTNIVYLDGDATLTSLSNQELTERLIALENKNAQLEAKNIQLNEKINTNVSNIESNISEQVSSIMNKFYPVGSIYITISDINPSTIYGGTWEKIKDRFLLSSGDTYKSGSTGGEATHTLTVNEMPAHSHSEHGLGSQGGGGATFNYPGGYGYYWGNTTGSAGGGKPHNNMPPYLVVNVWKRTA